MTPQAAWRDAGAAHGCASPADLCRVRTRRDGLPLAGPGSRGAPAVPAAAVARRRASRGAAVARPHGGSQLTTENRDDRVPRQDRRHPPPDGPGVVIGLLMLVF